MTSLNFALRLSGVSWVIQGGPTHPQTPLDLPHCLNSFHAWGRQLCGGQRLDNQTLSEPHALIAAGRTSTATAMIKSLAATPLSTALQFWAMAAFPLFFLLFKYFRDLFPALCYSRLYPNTAPWMNEISQRRLVRTPTASHCNMNIKKPLLFVIWITTGKKKPFQGIGWSLTHPQYRGG